MRRPAAFSANAGFTLVEALLAVLLMSVIVAALAVVTAQWMPSWDKGIARLRRVDALAVGLDRLTADLAAAEFVSAVDGNDTPIFDGAELSVVFVRTTLSPNAESGLQVVRIAETSDERGLVLVRSTAPYPPNMAGARDTNSLLFSDPVAMIRAAVRVAFSYAGPDRVWKDAWHQEGGIPRAVRVRLRDIGTSTTLAVSTSTLVHAELPARCTWARTVAECPALARLSSSAENAGGGVLGSQ
jgi:general secretion pathway protein J